MIPLSFEKPCLENLSYWVNLIIIDLLGVVVGSIYLALFSSLPAEY